VSQSASGSGDIQKDPVRDLASSGNPPVPEELEAAMQRALSDNPSPSATELLVAAERVLENVLRTDCEARASALDLLTVDALVTRALQIAARNPGLLAEFPEQAMQRIVQLPLTFG
jgi:hypothetical protein